MNRNINKRMNIHIFFSLDKLPSSSSLTSLSTSNNHTELQEQLKPTRTINCRTSTRKLEELNLYFDDNNDLFQRTKMNLLSVNDDEMGIKSPEISDHVQFLITEVTSSTGDDAEKRSRKVHKDDEMIDDAGFIANGMFSQNYLLHHIN